MPCPPRLHAVSPATLAAWAVHLGTSVNELDPDALRGELATGTVPGMLERAAARHPESTLAVDDERVTLEELRSRVARHAAVLADNGVTRGTTVAIRSGSSLALVTHYLAVLHLGAVAVLVNPAYTAAELSGLLVRYRPELLLVGDAPPEPGSSARTALTDARARGLGNLSLPVLAMAATAAEAERADERSPADLRRTDVALLGFTSGTSGTPKAAPLTHSHLLASIRGAMWAWRWSSDDNLVHALPLFHQHGLSGVHATLVAGSSAMILSRFDPDSLVAAVEREQATVMFAVPSIHRRLAALDRDRAAPLSRLRLLTSGSAPLSPALAQELAEKAGVLPLERYGLTETGLNLSNPYDGERVPGSVGIPLPGVEAALADEQGRLLGASEPGEGEIVLRGPQVFDRYLDDEEATAATFLPGGWFRTGDLGRWDAAGRMWVVGRLKDLVITGGMNVAPQEVERVLEAFPGVVEAAVAGLPSEQWGEEVTAWVVVADGHQVPEDQLMDHCRAHLATYKCPKQVLRVSALPRNAMGKIDRRKLAGAHR